MSSISDSPLNPMPSNPEDQPAMPPASGTSKPRHHLESPFISLFGLLVVWSSLVIIFTANRLSGPSHEADLSGMTRQNMNDAVMLALDSQVKILLPFSMFIPHVAPADALQTVGSYVNLHVDSAGLEKLDGAKHSYRYVNEPVYSVLHAIIGNPQIGYMIRNNNLTLFDQVLKFSHQTSNTTEMTWDADVSLSGERAIIVPSAGNMKDNKKVAVWLAARLTGDANQDISRWNAVQVEVHRGTELLVVARPVLDEKSNAVMSMSDVQTISMTINAVTKAVSGPNGKEPGTYHFHFLYQVNEANE